MNALLLLLIIKNSEDVLENATHEETQNTCQIIREVYWINTHIANKKLSNDSIPFPK